MYISYNNFVLCSSIVDHSSLVYRSGLVSPGSRAVLVFGGLELAPSARRSFPDGCERVDCYAYVPLPRFTHFHPSKDCYHSRSVSRSVHRGFGAHR